MAQKKETIHGVVNDQHGNPIENVNIKIVNTDLGTKTNAKGEFLLSKIDLPFELYFSHLAYHELNIEVSSTSFINIQLSEKSYMIGEVGINESIRLTGKFEYISDYEIYEDKLLYIGMRGGNPYKSYLVVADFFGEVKTKVKVHRKSDIFKDCMGVCHVLQKDTAYQIHFDGKKIHLLYPVSNKEFLNQFNNCTGVSKGNFIFKQYYNNYQTLYYYYINAKTRKINDMWMHKADGLGRDEYLTSGNNIYLYEKESEDRFYNEIMKQPIYSPLFKTKDEILVFNHLNNIIDVFSLNCGYRDSRRIVYHAQKDWKPQILHDEYNDSFYTAYEKNGIYTFKKVDTATGLLKENSFTISGKNFPRKIKVYNNTAFYLYREKDNLGYSRLYMEFIQ